MKRRWLTFALIASIGASGLGAHSDAAAPADGEQFVAAWSGTWEGGGSGKFDMKFERASDGEAPRDVLVGTDGGDYTAKFDTISFTGGKMNGRYPYPLDSQGEIIIEGNFDAAAATGTWALVQKGTTQAFINGTWSVRKK